MKINTRQSSSVVAHVTFAFSLSLLSWPIQAQSPSNSPSPAARISQEIPTWQTPSVEESLSSSKPSDNTWFHGNDEGIRDLGVQQVIVIKEDLNPISLSLGTGFLYTSNAGLSSRNEQEDWIWTSQLQAAWTPRIFDRFYLNTSLRQDLYRYEEFDEALDFDSLRLSAGFTYVIPKIETLASVLYGLQRTTEPFSWSNELYLNQNVAVGLQKTFRITRGNQIMTSYFSELSFHTDPETLKRHEHVFQLAHQVHWTPKLATILAYRSAYNDYSEYEDASAWNHTTALVINYAFTEWLTASATASYIWNQAASSAFDYEMQGYGSSIHITLKF